MNIKSRHVLLTSLLILTQSAFALDSIYENNLEVLKKKSEINSNVIESKKLGSSFYPELNIVTGVGSERTSSEDETDRGGILYLDSKFNLYNGQQDLSEVKINEGKINKAKIELLVEERTIQSMAYNFIQELALLSEDNLFLKEEIETNKKQSLWAQKKISAGLTTNIELQDFQIKETDLNNEININNFKISENKTELLNLFGNKASIDEIISKINQSEEQISRNGSIKTTLNEDLLNEDLKISDLEYQKNKYAYLPKLDLEARAGKITPTSKLLSGDTEHQIALTLTIPIFDGLNTQAEIQKSTNDKLTKEKVLRNYQNNLISIIETEKRKIELNNLLLKSLEMNLLKSKKFYNQTIDEYKRGIKNSSDLISSSDRILEFNRKINTLKKEVKVLTYDFNQKYTRSK